MVLLYPDRKVKTQTVHFGATGEKCSSVSFAVSDMFALKARCCSHGMCMLVCNVCIQVLLVRCICPRSLLQPMILLFTLADWEDVPLFECGIFFILCWACFQLSRCCFLHGRIATTSSQLSSHKTSEAAVQTDAMDGMRWYEQRLKQ